MAGSGMPMGVWPGSDAIRELPDTLKLRIASADKEGSVIGRLTKFMAVLCDYSIVRRRRFTRLTFSCVGSKADIPHAKSHARPVSGTRRC